MKEPQKYGWKPKELLTQISQVYLRIGRADSTGAFAEAIAADKRSYSEDLFPETMQVSVLLCIVARSFTSKKCNLGMTSHALLPRDPAWCQLNG